MTPPTESPPEELEPNVTPAIIRRRPWLRWLLPIVIFLLAVGLRAFAKRAPAFTEYYYSRRIFPRIAQALSFVNGIVGFSIGEMLVLAFFAVLIATVVYQTFQIVQGRTHVLRAIRLIGLTLLWSLSLTALLFLLLWGLNYDRQPLSASLNLQKQTPSDDQLESISRSIIDGANVNYQASHGTECCAVPNRAELFAALESAYQGAPLVNHLCRGGYARPKPVRFSGIMSWLGISGVYMPFTGEANYNRMQPDFDLPYAIAHEQAHQCGIAREDEANFVAFLVCANSTNAFVRYSGYLNALRVVGELAQTAPDRYRATMEKLGTGPRGDLAARTAFWMRFQGRASQVSHRINNSYLRANNVPGGTRSYSEDVALIISYYLKQESERQVQTNER